MAHHYSKHPVQDRWIKTVGRIGLVSIGVAYSLVGILTFAAAFELGDGSNKGKVSQVLHWVQEQIFGQILLAIITFGLFSYTIWRFIEAIKDPEKKGTSLQGLSIRASYFSYGAIYATITYYAFQLLISKGASAYGTQPDTRETLAQKLLEQPYGQWMLGIVALSTAGVGIFQLYLSLSGSYRKVIEEYKGESDAKEILIRSGQIGYIARGIVWLIVGYFLIIATLQADPSIAGDPDSALNYLEYKYGSLTLAIVSIGLVCYGIFMFVRARYQPLIK